MALVRARRLVFTSVGEGMNQSAEFMGLMYVVRPAHGGGWEWWLCLKTECKPEPTMGDAIDACQRDLDRRWLADTEVMPLEFVAWDDERAFRIEDGFTAFGAAGEYDLWLDDNKHVAASFRPDGSSESHVIHYEGKTKADAVIACNSHNRKTILGE